MHVSGVQYGNTELKHAPRMLFMCENLSTISELFSDYRKQNDFQLSLDIRRDPIGNMAVVHYD